MSEQVNIGLQHRLIGAEDIDWDKECQDEMTEFLTPFGVRKPLSKLNAGHIPLDNATSLKFPRAKTVAAALQELRNNATPTSGSGESGLASDTTVLITSAYANAGSIQSNLIDLQERNLNGHTLTFQFPAQASRSIAETLVFKDFRNGKVVIDLNGISLRMAANLKGGVLRFLDCQCSVEIKNGGISFASYGTAPGITAEECATLKCAEISFVNDVSSSASYAFHGLSADCHFSSCSVTNGLFYKGGTKNAAGAWTEAGGQWINAQQNLDTLNAGLHKITHIQGTWTELFQNNYIVSRGTDENGVSWLEYNSGLLLQWGKAKITKAYPMGNASSTTKKYAVKVNLAKRYTDTDFFIQVSANYDSNNDATFDSDNEILSLPSMPYNNPPAPLVPHGRKNVGNGYFIVIERAYALNAASTVVYNNLNSSAYVYEWLTIGMIHSEDATPGEED